MLANEQMIDPGDENVSLVDEKSVLVRRLDKVEEDFRLFKQWDEFLQRMSRLDKYLQAPDPASDFGKYEQAVAELSAVKNRLAYVYAQDSMLRKFVCFLGLVDTIPELEQEIVRRAWRVDQLCRKLKLIGDISLQQEYSILDGHLDRLIAHGFAPSAVALQIRALEIEKTKIHDRLARIEEQLKRKSIKIARDFSTSMVRDRLADVQSFAPQQSSPKRSPINSPQSSPINLSISSALSSPKRQSLFTHLNFWNPLQNDLNSASHSVVIVSPYLTVKRSKQFTKTFKNLLDRNVTVRVITLPQKLQSDHMVDQSASVIESLLDLGVEIITVPKIHQKIIVVDEKICWEGSMNWLSHRDTAEHIRRIENVELVAEVNESLNIYLKPTEAQYSDQPMIVTTNKSGPTPGNGTSLIHQEYVNVSPDQIEALLYDCSCCEEGGTFGPIFSSHF